MAHGLLRNASGKGQGRFRPPRPRGRARAQSVFSASRHLRTLSLSGAPLSPVGSDVPEQEDTLRENTGTQTLKRPGGWAVGHPSLTADGGGPGLSSELDCTRTGRSHVSAARGNSHKLQLRTSLKQDAEATAMSQCARTAASRALCHQDPSEGGPPESGR